MSTFKDSKLQVLFKKSVNPTQPVVAYENYDYMNPNAAYYDWPDWAPPVLTAVVTIALYGGMAYLVYDLTKKNVGR